MIERLHHELSHKWNVHEICLDEDIELAFGWRERDKQATKNKAVAIDRYSLFIKEMIRVSTNLGIVLFLQSQSN